MALAARSLAAMHTTLPASTRATTAANAALMARCVSVIYILHLCDLLTTAAGSMTGLVELNPLSRTLLAHSGIAGFAAAKIVVAGITIMSLSGMPRRYMMAITAVTVSTVGTVVLSNVAHLVIG